MTVPLPLRAPPGALWNRSGSAEVSDEGGVQDMLGPNSVPQDHNPPSPPGSGSHAPGTACPGCTAPCKQDHRPPSGGGGGQHQGERGDWTEPALTGTREMWGESCERRQGASTGQHRCLQQPLPQTDPTYRGASFLESTWRGRSLERSHTLCPGA